MQFLAKKYLFASLSDCKQLIAANKLIHLAGLRGASRTSADVVTIYLHSSTPCPSPVNIMREARAQQDFVLETSVRVAEPVKELISQQLHHSDVALRTSAILRFSVLWRFRYQVWPRLEYGAHIHFKVVVLFIIFIVIFSLSLHSCIIFYDLGATQCLKELCNGAQNKYRKSIF